MEPITFFTGVIISRLLAPVVKDGWKKITNAEAKDEEKRIKRVQEDVANKLMLQRQSHEDRLKEAEKAHELSMKLWEQKTYYERCWPLRNPFEMQICRNDRRLVQTAEVEVRFPHRMLWLHAKSTGLLQGQQYCLPLFRLVLTPQS